MARGGRKPGEPIYLRRHMVALAGAVVLPIVLLQLYKLFIGPLSFDIQLGVVLLMSILAGLGLYVTHRSSAQNEP
ncbi:MAG: hypothetical protein OEW25_09220 [Nitrospira sp.]|nr:hypothetical protein [Nitrospira sp.]MDH5253493.1 hypothetical protein [Nitrospira sp.]